MSNTSGSNTDLKGGIKNDENIVDNQSEPSFESQFEEVGIHTVSTILGDDEHVDYFDDSDIGAKGIIVKRNNVIWPAVCQFSTQPAILPNIGIVNIQNAQNTSFGDTTIYNGPVSIQRYIVDADDENREISFEADRAADQREDDSLLRTNCFQTIKQRWGYASRKMKLSVGAFIVLSSLLAISLMIVSIYNGNKSTPPDSPHSLPTRPPPATPTPPPPNGLRIVTRKMWHAIPPKSNMDKLTLPSTRVIIIHTGTQNCTEESECISTVQSIQRYHIEERKYSDIGYNYLIGGDGSVYEGRGWNIQGAHTKRYNRKSVGIAFIGTFNTELPPKKQIDAAKKLMDFGVQSKKLEILYKLYGQCQLISTKSPGKALYELIQKWKHFSHIIE